MPIRNAGAEDPPQPAANPTTAKSAAMALARIAHDPDGAVADRDGLRARTDGDRVDNASGRRIDPRDVVADRARDPHAALAHRPADRSAADGDAPDHPPRARVDLHDAVAQLVGDP